MRRAMGMLLMVSAAVSASCTDYLTDEGLAPAAPTGLYYQLEPSGDPDAPSGVILHWDASPDPDIAVYHVYGRSSGSGSFGLRGSTTSNSFHDNGQPQLEYYATAESQGGLESFASASVVIDESLRLPAPADVGSISLNSAIHLSWTDNAFQADPAGFSHYRVYSSSYDLDNDLCGTSWTLEGTTIAPSFLSGALVNGSPRCFGVSAITIEGIESLWSPLRYDTPRPDARNQIVYTTAANALASGFRFFLDGNGDGQASPLELGLISSGGSASVDFNLTAGAGTSLVITPVRAATAFRQFPAGFIGSLTDIDIAPVGGYSRTALVVQAGRGYVFEMADGLFLKYGALRITATGPDYIVFDWSYQTDPGNPELLRVTR